MRNVIIVGRNTGSARVSVRKKLIDGEMSNFYAEAKFEPTHENGYLNCLATLTHTLEETVKGSIKDVTIFTLGNLTKAIGRYYKCKEAVKVLKLEEQEAVQKTFELFVENKSEVGKKEDMSEEEQAIWAEFVPFEFEATKEGLLKEIRAIYTSDYIDKMEADLEALYTPGVDGIVIPLTRKEKEVKAYKQMIIPAHRKAWDLVAQYLEEETDVETAF
jgi:hypothetical protein